MLKLVCSKRKRKLRKKGIHVWWSAEFCSWAWDDGKPGMKGNETEKAQINRRMPGKSILKDLE